MKQNPDSPPQALFFEGMYFQAPVLLKRENILPKPPFHSGFVPGVWGVQKGLNKLTSILLNIFLISLGGSTINAFIVQFSTKRVASFKPSYISAYFASFLALLIGNILGLVGSLANISQTKIGTLFFLLFSFILGSAIYGFMLKSSENGVLGLRKGMLVSLVQILLAGALLLVVFLFFYIYRKF